MSAGADGYSRTEHLLFLVVDLLALANWQRGGGKGPRPRPLSPTRQPKQKIVGKGQQLPQEVILQLLAARAPKRPDATPDEPAPELWLPGSTSRHVEPSNAPRPRKGAP